MPDPLLIAIIVASALVQGYGGFGFGIVAVALAGLLAGPLASAAAVITACSLPLITVLAWLSRTDGPVRWRLVGLLFIGVLVGLPPGYWFVQQFGDQPLGRLILGISLLGFSGFILASGPSGFRWPRWMGLPAGVAGGFIGGAFTTGGPPVVLYCYGQDADPRRMKSTIQVVFMSISTLRLLADGLSGTLLQVPVLSTIACALPLAIAAVAIGHRLSRRSSAQVFTRIMLALIAGLGLLLILRNLS